MVQSDLRLTPDGRYVFLEINPAGQFLWIEQMTGQKIAATLATHLASPRRDARDALGQPPPRRQGLLNPGGKPTAFGLNNFPKDSLAVLRKLRNFRAFGKRSLNSLKLVVCNSEIVEGIFRKAHGQRGLARSLHYRIGCYRRLVACNSQLGTSVNIRRNEACHERSASGHCLSRDRY
jgi:hypothetical protein